jgi:hypothetical protein
MDVVSLCALRASGFEWQPRAGTIALTVVCKATFELHPKECVLAPKQEDLLDLDVHWRGDPRCSVVVPTDRTPYKPRADVVLVGHAYAPKQQPSRTIMTRFLVGEIDKSIEVWCDRSVRRQGRQVHEGPRITRMPLTWERAAGGPETSNPVGLQFDAVPDPYGMVAIPNLQPPGSYVSQWGDVFAPIGYGPIAPRWPSRARRLYQHAPSFAAQGWEKQPLPKDFDYGYFNVAPPDQQVEELRSNERIVMENLHPRHDRLVTSLPGIRPRAIADRATGEREEIALVADTLWIDTDRGICAVVWRGRIGLRHAQEAGRVAFWADGLPKSEAASANPKDAPVILSVAEKPIEKLGDATLTLTPFDDFENRSTLPFIKGASAPPPVVGITLEAPPPWLPSRADAAARNDGTGTVVATMFEPAKDPLPFKHGDQTPPRFAVEPAGTQAAVTRATGDGATGATTPRLEPTTQMLEASPSFHSSAAPVAPPQPVLGPSFSSFTANLVDDQESLKDHRFTSNDLVDKARFQEVAPPPMIGPLASIDTPVRPTTKPTAPAKMEAEREAPGPHRQIAPIEKKPGPEDFSLERCAALTARIARRKSDKARMLEEEKLSPEYWTAVEKHWSTAIQDETKKGKKTLLDRFDTAYVDQIEKERGLIDVREYAKLTVAAERGALDEVLEELQLPRGAVMRIERVWVKRFAKEPELAAKVEAAMEAERQ